MDPARPTYVPRNNLPVDIDSELSRVSINIGGLRASREHHQNV